jgi:drug/metabolite transporter (DMT)-like permease
MTEVTVSTADSSFSTWAILGTVLGLLVAAYGALLTTESLLGGLHVAAIGLTLAAGALLAMPWTARRLHLSEVDSRKLSWTFTGLSAVLLATFVVINYAGFESSQIESGSETGSD